MSFYKKVLLLMLSLTAFSYASAQEQGIIINEFSNGPSGAKEYIEFLVVGCSGARVDIRGWKFDDNNGDFSGGPVASKGIARGHSRFSAHAQWSNVPVGTLILVYNSGDKNSSITLPDDPSDANNDSVYVLTHDHTSFIEICDNFPNTGTGNDLYTNCTTYTPGAWATVGMRNDGDATQVRRPDGSYFHGFGWGDNDGGPDHLYFSGSGSAKVYSYTSPSCNYRDISNFTAQAAPAFETPGRANNPSNLNYIRFLKEHITPGIISGNQTLCPGDAPAALTESGTLVRCYLSFQWQSSSTNTAGSFQNIGGATAATFTPAALSSTTYFRRVVKNSCESDTSNVITATVHASIGRADQPSVSETELCVNPLNSTLSTNPVANATGFSWELFPASAGVITGTSASAVIDWDNTFSGRAKVVVKALGCGGNVASDTTFITLSNAQASAGSDQTGLCGTTASLSASGTGSWSIVSGNGGSFSNASIPDPLFTGVLGETYELEWNFVASSCMSAGADRVVISFSTTSGTVEAGDDQRIIRGESTTLHAEGNGPFTWTPSTGLNDPASQHPVAAPLETTTYVVSAQNGGCILHDTVTVYVMLCERILIPNLITPNGDDKNDSFVIGCTDELNWTIEISNQWGEIVYKNSHYHNEWKAEGLSDGIYYFYLNSAVLNVSYKGWVEVIN